MRSHKPLYLTPSAIMIAACAMCSTCAFAQRVLEQDVRARIKHGCDLYREAAKLLQGRHTGKNEQIENEKIIRTTRWTVLLKQGNQGCLADKVLETDESGTASSNHTAFSRTSKYTFEVSKKDDSWLLHTIRFDPKYRITHQGTVDDEVFYALSPHYRFLDAPLLADLMDDPNFRILKSTSSLLHGRSVFSLEVEFERTKKNASDVFRGTIDIDQEYGCVLKSSGTLIQKDGGKLLLQWENQVDLTPAGKGKILSRRSTLDYKKERRAVESTYDLHYDRPFPESEFSLTAFGLPEPHDGVRPAPTGYSGWFAAAGVAALAIGLGFAYQRRRKNQQPS